jgi:copper chaperone CopZ
MIATFLLLTTLTFKVPSMDCAACARPVGRTLASIAGVSNVHVNPKEKTATVDVAERFDREVIREKLLNAGFFIQFADEKEPKLAPLPDDVLKTLDIATFDGSRPVDFNKVPVPGKITIVDVYADWCGPCKTIELRLQHFVQGKNIAIRRINIGNWNTQFARHISSAFHFSAIPYLRVYDANGKLVGSVYGMWDELLDTVEKASK